MQFKILSRGLVAVVGCIALASAASDALAQQSSMFGGSSPTNGGGGFGNSASGANLQSTAFPTSSFPAGGMAQTGAGGQAGFGGPQAGVGAGAGQQTGGLLGLSSGTLIGTGAPPGVTGQTGQPGQAGQMNRQGQQNRNTANRRAGGGQNRNQMNQAGTGAGNQQKTTVRPQLLVAFDYPRPSAETIQESLATRFAKLASKEQFKGIDVEADGSSVILRGEVDSDRTSRLATILARMEPGVKRVRNELTVKEPPPPTPEAVE
jgi:hypothetical protein